MPKTPNIDYERVGLLLHVLKEVAGYPRYIDIRTAAERELQNIEESIREEMNDIRAEEAAALTTSTGIPAVPGLPVAGPGAPVLSSAQGGVSVGERVLSPGTSDVGAPAPEQGKLAFDGTPETIPGGDVPPPTTQNVIETNGAPPNQTTSPASAGTPATTELTSPENTTQTDRPSVKSADAPAETPTVPRRV